jgi:integrase
VPKIDSKTARSRLEVGKYHTEKIDKNVYLFYRRALAGGGTWTARTWARDKFINRLIGSADDRAAANGVSTLSYAQAREAALRWRDSLVRTKAGIEAPITVAEAAALYVAWRKENRKQAVDAESVINAHILPAFGDRIVASLTKTELQDWLEKVAATPARLRVKNGIKAARHAPAPVGADAVRARRATANRCWANFRAVLGYAFKKGRVKDDAPWRQVERFRNVDEPRIRFLTDAEAHALIAHCSPDLGRLVRGALSTGCRFGELTALRVGDVNLATKQVYIALAKGGKPRHIPLNDDGVAFFRDVIRDRDAQALVFVKADGQSWKKNHHVRALGEAAERAKIAPVGFHQLRHSYASALARAGVDLLTISKLLGHADTRITSRHYAHLCDASLSAAVTKLPSWGNVEKR